MKPRGTEGNEGIWWSIIYVGLCALKRLRWRKLAREVVEIETQWIENCSESMFSMGTAGEKEVRKSADLKERDYWLLHTSKQPYNVRRRCLFSFLCDAVSNDLSPQT